MGLRRGFKTEANKYAKEFREELSLLPEAPLSPWALAEHLGIKIELPVAIKHLGETDTKSFSAATVFCGLKRRILVNDYHSTGRQAASISHELSHAILGHPPTVPFNEYGCRNLNKEIEDEANWLSGALLISLEAAWYIAKQRINHEQAARIYGCTTDVIRWRINVTGANKKYNRSG
jgi:Zn-dependent peptidase ImmA (M78 family)